jgi:hypothetical protein
MTKSKSVKGKKAQSQPQTLKLQKSKSKAAASSFVPVTQVSFRDYPECFQPCPEDTSVASRMQYLRMTIVLLFLLNQYPQYPQPRQMDDTASMNKDTASLVTIR